MGFLVDESKFGLVFSWFIPFSPARNFIPSFLQTHLIHFVSFHFISTCDVATGVVGRHPCYSQTFSIGASSHLVPRSCPVSDMIWGNYFQISLASVLKPNSLMPKICISDNLFLSQSIVYSLYNFNLEVWTPLYRMIQKKSAKIKQGIGDAPLNNLR